ncbi:MAG: hypothetical protein MK100_02750 [Phycisphaerales bacterium]|nr:hypothetical protein [Phycisphaerales bacterium]
MTRTRHILALAAITLIAGIASAIGLGGWIENDTTYGSQSLSGDQWTMRAVAGQPTVATLSGDGWTMTGGRIGPADEICIGDWDGSGAVDITDLLTFLSVYGTEAADLNGDGLGDINDLLILLGAFGGCG